MWIDWCIYSYFIPLFLHDILRPTLNCRDRWVNRWRLRVFRVQIFRAWSLGLLRDACPLKLTTQVSESTKSSAFVQIKSQIGKSANAQLKRNRQRLMLCTKIRQIWSTKLIKGRQTFKLKSEKMRDLLGSADLTWNAKQFQIFVFNFSSCCTNSRRSISLLSRKMSH